MADRNRDGGMYRWWNYREQPTATITFPDPPEYGEDEDETE